MNLQQHKQKLLLNNFEFREEYYSYNLAFEIGQMILEARSIKGVTQQRLAEMIHTKQSGIARAENGTSLPSLSFLNKIAEALKTKLSVRFEFMTETAQYNSALTASVFKPYLDKSKVDINKFYSMASSNKYATSHTHQYAN